MDPHKYTTLLAAWHAVPDPRQARGKRHAWPLILTLIVAALASGQKNVRAIAQWAGLHATEILNLLALDVPCLHSASTFYRALRAVDIDALEARLAEYNQALAPPSDADTREVTLRTGETVQGQAVDGKEVRRWEKAAGLLECRLWWREPAGLRLLGLARPCSAARR